MLEFSMIHISTHNHLYLGLKCCAENHLDCRSVFYLCMKILLIWPKLAISKVCQNTEAYRMDVLLGMASNWRKPCIVS